MKVVIQTNIAESFFIWVIEDDGMLHAAAKKVTFHGSDKLLIFIDQTLRRWKMRWKSLNTIVVVRGPGPFTAVRAGIIVANTLGKVFDIPVSGIVAATKLDPSQLRNLKNGKRGSFVRPAYGREPNITMTKPPVQQLRKSLGARQPK